MKKNHIILKKWVWKITDVNFIVPQKVPKIILLPVQIKSKLKISRDFLKIKCSSKQKI